MIQLNTNQAITSLTEKLSAAVAVWIEKTSAYYEAVAHCYDFISPIATFVDSVFDYMIFYVVFPKWLTG